MPTRRHGGKASTAKLTVNGSPVLLTSSLTGQAIACTVTENLPSIKRCQTVLSITGGDSSKLHIGGQPVLLVGFTGTTDGAPPTIGAVDAGQSKLQG